MSGVEPITKDEAQPLPVAVPLVENAPAPTCAPISAHSPSSAVAPAGAPPGGGGPSVAAESAAAAVAKVAAVLARAEQDWQRGERLQAIRAYDEAVSREERACQRLPAARQR